MNSVNKLFVFSVILVVVLLISINYSMIHDFYTYSVSLKNFAIEKLDVSSDPDLFEKIKQQEGSTCFVTQSSNEYCFKAPRGDEDFRVSHPLGSNGITGEMHFEPADRADGYWTMSSIVPISNSTAIITFSDNSERYPSETLAKWHIDEKFEFKRTVEKYDTFVSYCANDGKYIEIIQYLGIFTVEDTDYVATWHVGATSEQGITCKYPEIIQKSFGYDFGI